MNETDYQYNRCIRNERKLDNLENKLDRHHDTILKLEIGQEKIMSNHLTHTFSKDSPKDIAIWLSPSVAVAILSNLDKISYFIEWIKTVLGG